MNITADAILTKIQNGMTKKEYDDLKEAVERGLNDKKKEIEKVVADLNVMSAKRDVLVKELDELYGKTILFDQTKDAVEVIDPDVKMDSNEQKDLEKDIPVKNTKSKTKPNPKKEAKSEETETKAETATLEMKKDKNVCDSVVKTEEVVVKNAKKKSDVKVDKEEDKLEEKIKPTEIVAEEKPKKKVSAKNKNENK